MNPRQRRANQREIEHRSNEERVSRFTDVAISQVEKAANNLKPIVEKLMDDFKEELELLKNSEEKDALKLKVIEEEDDDLGDMSFGELKKLAKQRGINSFGIKKDELLEKLRSK